MTTFTVIKDPQDVVQYTLRWYPSLGSDTVSTSTWTVSGNESPLALIKDSSTLTNYTDVSPNISSVMANVIVSAGTLGEDYTLTNHVVTSSGQEFDCSIKVMMRHK